MVALVRIEPTDEQLPEMVRVQETGIRILVTAATAFLASAVPIDHRKGTYQIPRKRFDALVRAANEGAYQHGADAASARVGSGLTSRQLRGLWRFQEDQYSTLRGPAQHLWLECRLDPADHEFHLAETRQLNALRAALDEMAMAEEYFAAALRAAPST